MAATYTAANVALAVTPDLTGFFTELDRRLRGYTPPPIPGPDVDPPDTPPLPPPDTSDAEDAIEGGLVSAAAAGAALAAVVFAKGFSDALDLADARGQLTAQLGDPALAKTAGEVAAGLFASGWAESVGDAGAAVQSAIKQGLLDPATQSTEEMTAVMSRFAIAAQTGGAETADVMRATGSLVKTGLAADVAEATDLITRGFQTNIDVSGEFLDVMTEYGPNFDQLGFSGAQAIGLINQALANGAYSADQVGDAFREFGIKMLDGSADADGAISGLGLNFGQLQADIAAGGDRAAGAFDLITDKIRSTEDPLARNTAGVAVFGSMWEDSGGKIAAVDLSTAVQEMDGLAGATDRAGQALDTPSARFAALGNTLQLGVANVIDQYVLPAVLGLTDALGWFVGLPGVPEVLGFVASAGAGVAITLGVITGAIKAWTLAQWLWNAAMAASPLTWVAIVLGALVGALVYAYTTSETFRNVVDAVFGWIGDKAVWLWENALRPAFDFIAWGFGELGKGMEWVWNNILRPPFEAFPGFVDKIAGGLQWAWDKIQKIFGHPVYFVLETVWNKGIGGLWNKAKEFGLPLGDFGFVDTSGIPHFADGGPIRGTSPHKRADNIPIWATAGEYMLDVDDVRRLGGPAAIDEARKRLARGEDGAIGLAYGGVVPHVAAAGDEITRLFGPMPGGIGGVGKRGNVSDHPVGLALDFMTMRNLALGDRVAQHLQDHAARMQVKYLIWKQRINKGDGWRGMEDRGSVTANHFDHVHASFRGWFGSGSAGSNFSGSASGTIVDWFTQQVQGLFDGAGNALRSTVATAFPPNGTFVGDLPVKATDWGIGKVRDFLFGKAKAEDEKAGAAGGGGNVEQWRPVVLQALGMLGLSPNLVGTTLRRMNQESGGNPRAINNWDSNAARGTPSKGLMQVIDPTFRANYDPRTPNDIWNPLSNIVASMKYALRRYGSLPAAYDRAGGYDTGGELLPGLTPVWNGLGHSETVIPLPPALVDNLLAQGRTARETHLHVHGDVNDPVNVDVLMSRLNFATRAVSL